MANFMTDPDEMRRAAARFDIHADNIHADAQKAWASTNDIVGGAWQGSASMASHASVEQMNQAFIKIRNMCSDVADNLRSAAQNYEGQEHQNQSALRI